jgi:hypothetical protein
MARLRGISDKNLDTNDWPESSPPRFAVYPESAISQNQQKATCVIQNEQATTRLEFVERTACRFADLRFGGLRNGLRRRFTKRFSIVLSETAKVRETAIECNLADHHTLLRSLAQFAAHGPQSSLPHKLHRSAIAMLAKSQLHAANGAVAFFRKEFNAYRLVEMGVNPQFQIRQFKLADRLAIESLAPARPKQASETQRFQASFQVHRCCRV